MKMKRSISHKLIFVAVLLCAVLPLAAFGAESQAIEKGKVIERVVCQSDPQQSYALFLPSGYAREKRWPILYCFDPAARGRVPVERFKDAAEKYGYIVVGSHNSRNGSNEAALAAAQAMMDDTQARFSINDRRVYTAGFSGGARVACRIGYLLKGPIAGVIACGAGFPQGINPSRDTPFPLFGTVGIEDFNFPEMKQLARALDSFAIANRVAVFEGSHSWAPSAVCAEAIEWMELQAMKSSRREKDERLIEALLGKNVERAQSYDASKKFYEAFVSYEALARNFKGLKDVAEFERRASELKEMKEVKLALKQELEMEKAQSRRMNELLALKSSMNNSETGRLAFGDLKNSIASLKKTIGEKESSPESLVARRALNHFFAFLSEESDMLKSRKQYAEAAEDLSLIAIIAPNNPRVHYDLACAYSLNKDKSRALEALKKSVEKGFKDSATLESDKELDPLREEADYKRLVEDLKKRSE